MFADEIVKTDETWFMKSLMIKLFVLLAFSVACSSPEKPILENFQKAVPESVRKPFCTTLRRLVDAQRNEKWSELYALQQPSNRPPSFDEFVRNHGGYEFSLTGFRVFRVYATVLPEADHPSGAWEVLGCVSGRDRGRHITAEGATTVYLEDGTWYTETVHFSVPMSDFSSGSGLKKCKMTEAVDLDRLCSEK